MDSRPISSTFGFFGTNPLPGWDTDIQNLQADEKQNPQNTVTDEKDIQYDKQLEDNFEQMQKVAAEYRKSDNDPNLAKQLQILNGRQQTLTQLLGLDTYIKSLEADTKKYPQDAAANAQKIANAQQQEQCIQQFQTAWEAYQQSGNPADGKTLDSLIEKLQDLRKENPAAPYSNNLIWEDFQTVVDKGTVLEFLGHKYLVEPHS